MKIYIKSTTYRYSGSIEDKFGNIKIRDAEFETVAANLDEAKSNILYQAKRRLGLKPNVILKFCNPKGVKEVSTLSTFQTVRRCPHCGTQLSDGGYCPKCYAYGNETNYSM